MANAQVEFGGGALSPKMSEHLKRATKAQDETTSPRTQFGSGVISPRMRDHLARATESQNRPVQFGGGFIGPKLAKHILSRALTR